MLVSQRRWVIECIGNIKVCFTHLHVVVYSSCDAIFFNLRRRLLVIRAFILISYLFETSPIKGVQLGSRCDGVAWCTTSRPIYVICRPRLQRRNSIDVLYNRSVLPRKSWIQVYLFDSSTIWVSRKIKQTISVEKKGFAVRLGCQHQRAWRARDTPWKSVRFLWRQ